MTRLAALGLLAGCHAVPDAGTMSARWAIRHRPVTAVYLGDPAYQESFDLAVDLWNRETDERVLVQVYPDGPDADVAVFDGACSTDIATASPGLIRYHRPGDTYQAYLAFAHELGHAAFGLAHDVDHGCSIMAPDVASREPWGPALKYVCITEMDRVVARGAP